MGKKGGSVVWRLECSAVEGFAETFGEPRKKGTHDQIYIYICRVITGLQCDRIGG